MRGLIQVLLVTCVALLASAQERAQTKSGQPPPGTKGHFEVETARVEEVLKITDDGYRFIAYIVTWHGERVVVSDPLARTDHVAGDEISIMVHKMELPSSPAANKKTLSFMITESTLPKPSAPK